MAQPMWNEADQTSGLEPMVSMPKIVGGVRIAKIDAAFDWTVGGKKTRFRVRERSAYPNAKVVAVCLGQRRGGRLEECMHCRAAKAEGEMGLDALYKAHPTEMQLRKLHEQHVFALFCAEPLDPEGHADRTRAHAERLEAIKQTQSALERQALCNEWGYDPRSANSAPIAELIGLLSDAAWGESGIPLTM